MVPSIQSSIQESTQEVTSSSTSRRVSWYDLPVQSTSFVEGQLPKMEGACTADGVRLECDSSG